MAISLSTTAKTVQMRSLESLNTQIAQKGDELSSGYKVTTYQDLGEVRGHLRASDARQRIESTQNIIATEMRTLSQQETSTRTILDQAENILVELMRVRDDASEESSFLLNIASALNVIEGALNTKNGDGRFIFGRDVQTTRSVDFSQVQDVTVLSGGSIVGEYYAGGRVAPEVTIDSSDNTVALTLDASNQGIEKIVRALKLGALAPNDFSLLGTALDTLTEGIADTADLMLSAVGVQKRILEEGATILDQELVTAQEILSENLDANVTQTYTEFVTTQMHLQATLSFIQKVNNTLSEFISNMRR